MISHVLSENVYQALKSCLEKSRFAPAVMNMMDDAQSYPKAVISELSNTQSVRDGSGMISHSLIQIEIDIYAQNQTYEGVEYSGKDIAVELMDVCDEICDGGFGMKRDSWKPSVNVESGYYRLTVVYKATQDDMRSVFF